MMGSAPQAAPNTNQNQFNFDQFSAPSNNNPQSFHKQNHNDGWDFAGNQNGVGAHAGPQNQPGMGNPFGFAGDKGQGNGAEKSAFDDDD